MTTTNQKKLAGLRERMRADAERRHVRVAGSREDLIATGLVKPKQHVRPRSVPVCVNCDEPLTRNDETWLCARCNENSLSD